LVAKIICGTPGCVMELWLPALGCCGKRSVLKSTVGKAEGPLKEPWAAGR
jgi:hypothetical protein